MDERTRQLVQLLDDLRRAGVREWRRSAAPAVLPRDSNTALPSASRPAPPSPAVCTPAPVGDRQLTASGEQVAASQPPGSAWRADDAPRPGLDFHPRMAEKLVPVPGVVAGGPVRPASGSASAPLLFPNVAVPQQPATPPACLAFQPLDLPLAERIERLAVLKSRVAACTRCSELASTRKQTVFGVGDPQARLLFIGEAPGAEEDLQGEPFVGKAGQLLNDIIRACRLRREDVYICNVLRCRPPGNRLPAPHEAANCREYLDGQIAVVNPEYIVCWGACAAQNLLGTTESIGKLRRRFYQYGRAKVLCTYHPSYLLRNPAAKKDVWDDMKFLFLDMGVDLTRK
uniref:Type-4 uracil-DNA glycosylase n=1 Tax=Schlesneria paludicola TaxID=360056 RepID=A0A7C4QQ15_9PLAN